MNLPIIFKEKMKNLLGSEYEDYRKSYEYSYKNGLRINTGKISVEAFLKINPFHLTPIPWIENGFYYEEQDMPSKHPYYFAGLYYLQEPSAMTPANRLPVKAGEYVLDLCAAPGGKATELGAKLQQKGLLVANDISSSRAKGLLKNIVLFGIGNSLIVSEEPQKLEQYFTGFFDKILIDAPCSGEGMFRKDSSMIKSWEENGPDYYQKLQKEIVTSALEMLKPGGMLLYSTCTFSREEDEEVIAYLLSLDTDLEMIEIEPYSGFSKPILEGTEKQGMAHCVRIWPHKMEGEGHFLGLLKKKGTPSLQKEKSEKQKMQKENALPESLLGFLENTTEKIPLENIQIIKEQVYLLPDGLPTLKGLRILRTGLHLGEIKKKRFEPSQAFALYLTEDNYKYTVNIPLGDQRVIKYLKGETLDIEQLTIDSQGSWQLILVAGYPLGWAKLVNDTLRNKYYAGWRWQ